MKDFWLFLIYFRMKKSLWKYSSDSSWQNFIQLLWNFIQEVHNDRPMTISGFFKFTLNFKLNLTHTKILQSKAEKYQNRRPRNCKRKHPDLLTTFRLLFNQFIVKFTFVRILVCFWKIFFVKLFSYFCFDRDKRWIEETHFIELTFPLVFSLLFVNLL